MKKKLSTIGLFDAKTHLSELLADVERGNTVTITNAVSR